MQRTDFGAMQCSIARTLAVAGEPWSPLILRDVYVGLTRFDELQHSLGLSRKILAGRLRWLVDQGILERRRYSSRPPRFDYLLTDKGRDFCNVLLAIAAWGDRWTAGDAGPPVLFRHTACGRPAHPVPHCSSCGEEMDASSVVVEPGPGLSGDQAPPGDGAAES